ncbi:MAG: formate/nitrite transporter family protein [Tissierellia bacterium]|nr:formate/nitrite transporter family protein [Tissierellia bacterium]
MVQKVAYTSKAKVRKMEEDPLGFGFLTILAGIYVGIGVILAFTIGALLEQGNIIYGKIHMGFSFTVALSLVIMAGSELFTGNIFTIFMGAYFKFISLKKGIKILVFSWIGNFIGSLFIGFLFFKTGLIGEKLGAFFVNSGTLKVSALPSELLIRGFLCNLLVCLGVWTSFKMKTEVGKLILIFWCIFAFFTSGFEHSVANMTIFPLCSWISPSFSISSSFVNLCWVSLGNVLGGCFLGYFYGKIGKAKI